MARASGGSVQALFLAVWLTATAPVVARAQDANGEKHHLNHAGLSLGVTRLEGHSSFTLGADYERTLPIAHERLAVGALVDAAVGNEPRHVILAATVSFRPIQPLKLLVGPGIEFSHGERNGLFRAGGSIDVTHAGPVTISPGLVFDFVGGHTATVFGVTFGVGF